MKTDNSAFLGEDRLFPLLVRMSTPAIIGMMVMALYNVVDTIFVGRGAGSLAIAGLAIAFPIQFIVAGLGQMVGAGAGSIISRRLGEKNLAEAEATMGTGIVFIAVVSLLLTILLAVFTDPILRMFGATDTILPYTRDYILWLLVALPLHAIGMAANNLIRAEGNAKMAMNTMLIGIILNIILDPIFIFGLGMGIKGAAIATVIGQTVSFLWIAYYYLGSGAVVSLKLKHLRIRRNILSEIVILGLPNFIQMAGISIIATLINNILGAQGGDVAISAYGIISRLITFIFMPINGVALGFQPIAGFNYGARRYDRVRDVFFLAIASSTVIAVVCWACVMLFPNTLIGWFSTDRALLDYTAPALTTMALLTPLAGAQMISSIYFQAVGKGVPALLLGLSRQFIILLPVVILFSRFYGADGVWWSFPTSDAISTVVTVIAVFFELRHLRILHKDTLAERLKQSSEVSLVSAIQNAAL